MSLSEWSAKNIARLPILAVVFSAMGAVIIWQARVVSEQESDKKELNLSRFLCEQDKAQTISKLKDDQIKMIFNLQAKFDSLLPLIRANKDQIKQIKRAVR